MQQQCCINMIKLQELKSVQRVCLSPLLCLFHFNEKEIEYHVEACADYSLKFLYRCRILQSVIWHYPYSQSGSWCQLRSRYGLYSLINSSSLITLHWINSARIHCRNNYSWLLIRLLASIPIKAIVISFFDTVFAV